MVLILILLNEIVVFRVLFIIWWFTCVTCLRL